MNTAPDDEFVQVVEQLVREFEGHVQYDVVAGVAIEEWSRYQSGGGSRWTAYDVADAASRRLRRTIARRTPISS